METDQIIGRIISTLEEFPFGTGDYSYLQLYTNILKLRRKANEGDYKHILSKLDLIVHWFIKAKAKITEEKMRKLHSITYYDYEGYTIADHEIPTVAKLQIIVTNSVENNYKWILLLKQGILDRIKFENEYSPPKMAEELPKTKVNLSVGQIGVLLRAFEASGFIEFGDREKKKFVNALSQLIASKESSEISPSSLYNKMSQFKREDIIKLRGELMEALQELEKRSK